MAIEHGDKAPITGLGETTPPPNGARLADLVSEISALTEPIAAFWAEREFFPGAPRRRLTREQESQLSKLIQPRNQLIIDLLIERNDNDWSNVLVVLNKGIQGVEGFKEKTHPFSDNGVTIYAPSSRGSDSDFTIKVKLSGLRRKGVADNSLGAEELLGEKTQSPESPEDFMFRTQRELAQINQLRIHAFEQPKDGQTTRAIDYFNQLTADIITGRLVELKRRGKTPPSFGVYFFSWTSEKKHEPYETTRIQLPNGEVRNFVIPGQRIGAVLASFGFDYDKM